MGDMMMLERSKRLRDTIMSSVTPERDQTAYIDVTPASDWFFQESDQDYWDLYEHMHRLTLPAAKTWMEFRLPQYSLTENGRVTMPKNATADASGGLFLQVQLDPDEDPYANYMLEAFFSQVVLGGAIGNAMSSGYLGDHWGSVRAKHARYFTERPPRFIVGGLLFAQESNGNTEIASAFAMYLDENGRFYPRPTSESSFVLWTPAVLRQDIDRDTILMMSVSSILPFAFAISLMNCNNVSIEPRERKLARHERRRMMRDGIEPGAITYKWLMVRQLRKRVESASGAPTGKKRKQHIMAASWATYTEDAPLFGRPGLTGTFWRPQSWRGAPNVGGVVKAYNLDKPTKKGQQTR